MGQIRARALDSNTRQSYLGLAQPFLNTLFRLYSGVLGYIEPMMRHIRYLVTMASVAIFAMPFAAHGAAKDPFAVDFERILNSSQLKTLDRPAYFAQNQQRRISASRAKSIAQSKVRGAKYVDVQLVRPDLYRVRLQKDGRIIDVYVDAYSGAVRN